MASHTRQVGSKFKPGSLYLPSIVLVTNHYPMIQIFRKLRYGLMETNQTGKYLKYAFGEILLVVIGILIALQINNWNEDRKAHKMAKANYLNLLTSLQQDSIDAQRALKANKTGMEALRKIIAMEKNEALLKLPPEELSNYLYEVSLSSRSFVPNSGIYNVLTSNNGFDLIKSDHIKSLLINLYDYQYKDYAIVDAPIDEKYQQQLGSLIKEKIGLVVEYTPQGSVVQHASPEQFEAHYLELAAESRDIYSILSFNMNVLNKIQESINELLSLLRDEIRK